MQETNFTLSVNINRDTNRQLHYIPTPNANTVARQVISSFKLGIHSFNLIGSFGTGKSAFLWAFQQCLQGKQSYFDLPKLDYETVGFINIVGEYRSLADVIANLIEEKNNENTVQQLLTTFGEKYFFAQDKQHLTVIVIDEFGKFLEYAARTEPEKELYFLQQFAEFVNDTAYNCLFIAALHQNLDAYSWGAQEAYRSEWLKVKGRFKELTFNEPIGQLIFLASSHRRTSNKIAPDNALVQQATKLSLVTRAFEFENNDIDTVAQNLYPLDLLSTYVLSWCLQRYGQNERSLFSFLETADFNQRNNAPFYSIAAVYDYLNYNFYAFLISRHNPDYSAWAAIRSGLELTERAFDEDIDDYLQIIKTIGLLNLASAKGAMLDEKWLIEYVETILGIGNVEHLIHNLVNKKIIFFRYYAKRFVLFEGTDMDIAEELEKAAQNVEVKDIVAVVKKYFDPQPILAKAHLMQKGTPRFFEYEITTEPIQQIPSGEIDGYVNLVVNEKVSHSAVKKASAKNEDAILYGYYHIPQIKHLLFEIEKVEVVLSIAKTADDNAAIKELNLMQEHLKDQLKSIITTQVGTEYITWFYRGKEISIDTTRQLNKKLSDICDDVYPETPVYFNDLINRHRISNSIGSAKRNFLKQMTKDSHLPNWGFKKDKFPPEKTIYLTLVKENNIEDNNLEDTSVPFYRIWQTGEAFLESAKHYRKPISDLFKTLSATPFKLKQGLLEFWLPIFLYHKRYEFALFHFGVYVPTLTAETLELIQKLPENYEVKTFDVAGLKLEVFNHYRQFLNQPTKETIDSQTFIETIKPFLSFYKGLKDYAKQTKRFENKDALSIREAIAQAKDPEKVFFEDFPAALGYSLTDLTTKPEAIEDFTVKLQNAIRDIRASYDNLVQRFEDFILNEIVGQEMPFEKYQLYLQERIAGLKQHLLLHQQKTLVIRIESVLPDRQAWLNSLAHAIIGKSLENFSDNEEVELYDRFKTALLELDSLKELTQVQNAIDDTNEEVLSVELVSFAEGKQKSIVRLPKAKLHEIEKLKENLRKQLGTDVTLNAAAIVSLLNELLHHDKK